MNENKEIYQQHFKSDFTYDEFSMILMKNCTVKRSNINKKSFITKDTEYNKVIYFVNIPKYAMVSLKHSDVMVGNILEGSWIGVVEFISQVFYPRTINWVIGLEADNPSEEEIVWLEWNKDVFHKIFNKYKNSSFLKKLLINWMRYLAIYTNKLDKDVSSSLEWILEKKDELGVDNQGNIGNIQDVNLNLNANGNNIDNTTVPCKLL